MLSSLIDDILGTIDQLLSADLPDELNTFAIANARASATALKARTVPRITASVADVAAMAAVMTNAVETLLDKGGDGPDAAALRKTLKSKAQALSALEAAFERIETDTQSNRDFFSSTAGEFAELDRDFTSQVASANAASEAARADADKLRRRIDRENRNAVLNPFGRLIFEIRSLVEQRKTSEQVARDAERRARAAATKSANLRAPLAAVGALQALLVQLAAAMQDISNAITMITSMIDVQQDFTNRIKAEPDLFLNALEASLEVLRSTASIQDEPLAAAS